MSSIKRLTGLCCLPVVACILATLPACGTEEGAGPRQQVVTIDDQGGALVLENAEVTVPPGALAGARELTMTEGAEPPVGIPEEYEQASEFYTLEPHGLVFATLVTVRLPYRQVGYPPDLLRLDDDNDTTWEPVPGVTFTDREASFQTDHFCHLVIGGRKKCKDQDGDGYGIACDAGWDCDDDDPDVHPDGAESPHHAPACQNQKDDDCDGLTDAEDDDCDECSSDAECDDFNHCTDDRCDLASGTCGHEPTQNPGFEGGFMDPSCNNRIDDDCDGLADSADPDCKACLTDIDCDDSNPCTTDECGEVTCIYTNAADGTLCDDRLYCTLDDSCHSGTCIGQARNCDDANVCTLDVCNEDLDQCEHPVQPIPGAEGPSDTCQNAIDDDCDGLTDVDDPDCAVCITDADCDDGMYCTDPDTCTGGVCTTPARDCSQLDDACNLGLCNEIANQCEALPQADGTPCDDGLFCTINDACQSGSCTLRDPQDCDDGDACTQDACDEAGNQCIHILVPNPGAEGPAQSGTCSNGVDDDCDGLTDTDDPDC